MAKAYYGSRFSPNMTQTPEGFLICHNVPIARTGWYQYLGEEISPDLAGKLVRVYRSPEEVFDPAAIASFEGKPLTDEHPPEWVTPDNSTVYTKGITQNVRQGSGDNGDLLLADLVTLDRLLIEEIMDGKREVSAGYDLVYVDMGDGTFQQRQIRGNHVAVVKAGRAGDRVAIKDSQTTPPSKGEMKMSLAKKLASHTRNLRGRATDFLVAVGLQQVAKDGEPEDIMAAVDALNEERAVAADEEEDKPNPTDQQQANDGDTTNPDIAALEAKFDAKFSQLMDAVTKISLGTAQKDAQPEDAIDEAISQLEGQSSDDNNEEESHTIPTESLDDEGPVTDPEDRPQNLSSSTDNAYKIQALKAIKPILAEIQDLAARKRATDKAIKEIVGKPSKNTYAEMTRRQKTATDQKSATQSQTRSHAQDNSQLGQDWAKQFNPHYKDRA